MFFAPVCWQEESPHVQENPFMTFLFCGLETKLSLFACCRSVLYSFFLLFLPVPSGGENGRSLTLALSAFSFNVTVEDTEAPMITCPGPIEQFNDLLSQKHFCLSYSSSSGHFFCNDIHHFWFVIIIYV